MSSYHQGYFNFFSKRGKTKFYKAAVAGEGDKILQNGGNAESIALIDNDGTKHTVANILNRNKHYDIMKALGVDATTIASIIPKTNDSSGYKYTIGYELAKQGMPEKLKEFGGNPGTLAEISLGEVSSSTVAATLVQKGNYNALETIGATAETSMYKGQGAIVTLGGYLASTGLIDVAKKLGATAETVSRSYADGTKLTNGGMLALTGKLDSIIELSGNADTPALIRPNYKEPFALGTKYRIRKDVEKDIDQIQQYLEKDKSFATNTFDLGAFHFSDIKQISVGGVFAIKNNPKALQDLRVTHDSSGGLLKDGSSFTVGALHEPQSARSLKVSSSIWKAGTQENDKKLASSFADTITEKQRSSNNSVIER